MDRFNLIDKDAWDRKDEFVLYTEKWTTCTFTLNKRLDVTKFIKTLKEQNLRFVPSLIYLVSLRINKEKNFKIQVNSGELGYWDYLNPMYPSLNKNHNITFHILHFQEDYKTFYDFYVKEQEESKDITSIFAEEYLCNSFIISIANLSSFESCSYQLRNAKEYFTPILFFDKYKEENGKVTILCSFTINHAVADAYHVSSFFDDLQDYLNEFKGKI